MSIGFITKTLELPNLALDQPRYRNARGRLLKLIECTP